MKREKTKGPAKVTSITLLIALAVLIFLSAFQKQHWDSDIFWALKSGELIAATFTVPAVDPFSYTFAGSPWIDFTWGFQLIAHYFFTIAGGWYGLFILEIGLLALTFAFLYLDIRLLSSGRLWMAAALVALFFATAHQRFFIRPHLFAYLFIVLYFYLLNLSESGRSKRWVLLLIPLQVLWVNIHSSFVLGAFITGGYAAGAFIDEYILGRGEGRRRVSTATWLLIAVAVALPLVSLINPYGYRLAFFPLVHMGGENAEALRYIGEWTPLNLKEMLFYFYPWPVNHFVLKALFYALVIAMIMNRRNLKARYLILLPPVAYMALLHVRWTVIFALFALPILASNLSDLFGRRPGMARLRAPLMLFTVAVTALLLYAFIEIKDRRDYGIGIKEGHFPEGTASFVRDSGIKGNIINSYVYGGYLIYNLPEHKVFIDGRTPTVYSPYFFWTTRLADNGDRWKRLQQEHDLTVALVRSQGGFCKKLRDDEEWIAVHFDDVSTLFLKDAANNRAVIEKSAIREVKACSFGRKYEMPDEDAKLLKMRTELSGVIAEASVESALSHRLLGLVGTELGGDYLEEALAELNKAVELSGDPLIYYDIGIALLKLESFEEALEAFKRLGSERRGFKESYYGKGLAYYFMKDYSRAAEELEEYIDLSGDSAKVKAYEYLGLSLFKLGSYGGAVSRLKRAAFLTDEPRALSDIHYYLGSSHLELSNLSEGLSSYRRSLALNDDYRKVFSELSKSLEAQGKGSISSAVAGLLDDK